jgi:hypothetical protein
MIGADTSISMRSICSADSAFWRVTRGRKAKRGLRNLQIYALLSIHFRAWRRTTFGMSTVTRRWSGGASEELVHGEGAFFHDGPELVAVDDLGGARGGVAGQAGDFLDRDAGVGHEADEGVAELARRPGAGYRGGFDGGAELAADVGCVELAAVSGREYRSCFAEFAVAEFAQRRGGEQGQAEGAPGPGSLGVAMGADGPPDRDAGRPRGSGIRVAEVDVLPVQGAGFLGADAGAEAEGDVGADAGPRGGAQ